MRIGEIGLEFCDILTLIFITLKLLGKIDWSWLWVLSPIWVPFAIVLSVIFVCRIIMIVCK